MTEDRGSLSIADRALTRITRQVTLDVPGVAAADSGGTVERTLGRGYPRVHWQRAGNRARVEIEVAILWPVSAAHVAATIQSTVRRELERIAGQDVAAVTVAVRDVVRPHEGPVARVR